MAARRVQRPGTIAETSIRAGDSPESVGAAFKQTEQALQDLQRQVRALKEALADVSFARSYQPGTAAAPPSTGTARQGDVVQISNPVAGGFLFWVCVASGTPGTWKAAGAIQP